MTNLMFMKCFVCGSEELVKIIEINKRPDVEVDYSIPESKYHRTIYQCENCETYNNIHQLIDEQNFYQGTYNRAIDINHIKTRFEKIIALPPSQSDNKQRVSRIINFVNEMNLRADYKNILDVGSGTGVFLHEFVERTDFQGHCIDPDQQAVDHALQNTNISTGHCGTIFDFESNTTYDIISFNKILEHVKDPVRNLRQASKLLKPDGLIYVELPEADRIVSEGLIGQRAEFAVEHFTVFNTKSITWLAQLAGLEILSQKTITDPSGKYTIYAFLGKK